jgi:hypothetical protein
MALPAGTVTLLFSDIEGSTRLLEQLAGQARTTAIAGRSGHGAPPLGLVLLVRRELTAELGDARLRA